MKSKILLTISLCFSCMPLFAQETIYLISSSSAYNEDNLPLIEKAFNNKGYRVNTDYLDQQLSDYGYVNTDKERANTLVKALKDPKVKYLWFLRGGSGALNLLPQLTTHISEFKKVPPKVLIGFSDVTALHYFINENLDWKSIHGATAATGKVINSATNINANLATPSQNKSFENSNNISPQDVLALNTQQDGIDEIFSTIHHGVQYKGMLPLNPEARKNPIKGKLSGGNLTLIQTLFSTRYEKSWDNKILLLEDVGVTYKQLDRLLHQLLFKTNFQPKAIVFGQFYPSKTNDGERLIYKDVIRSYANQTKIPVYYYPYFGHGKINKPFILGENANISCDKDSDYCDFRQGKL